MHVINNRSRSWTTLVAAAATVLGFAVTPAWSQEPFGPDLSNQGRPSELAAWLMKRGERQRQDTIRLARERNVPLVLELSEGKQAHLLGFASTMQDDGIGQPNWLMNEMQPSRRQEYRKDQDPPIYGILFNQQAAITTRTNKLWPNGGINKKLTGNGVTISIFDGNIVFNHNEMASRVTNLISDNGSVDGQQHSTHVAGTMIATGLNALAKGMAPEAKLRAYDFYSNVVGNLASEASSGIPLSNHSWGRLAGFHLPQGSSVWNWYSTNPSTFESDLFGQYHQLDRDWDLISRVNPYHLMIKAAGNDRLQGPSTTLHPRDGYQGSANGFDSIPTSSVAKNPLIVGAVKDGFANVLMCAFSSAGPTDDGRIKPDVVGNGDGLFSTFPGNTYATGSGTSMACPNVTGTAALLVQQWSAPTYKMVNRRPALVPTKVPAVFLKGLLIHTAQDAGNPGPDYQYGWGLVNAEAAALFANHQIPSTTPKLSNWSATTGFAMQKLKPGSTYKLSLPCATPGQPIKVTLIWMDPAGSIQSGTLGPDPFGIKHLVNDLNLKVNGPSGSSLPFVLSPNAPAANATVGTNTVDNVEQVIISPGTAGNYEIEVSHAGGLHMNQPQDFCVLWTNLRTSGGDLQPAIKPPKR